MNSSSVGKFIVDIPKKKITFVFNNNVWKNCSTMYINILNDWNLFLIPKLLHTKFFFMIWSNNNLCMQQYFYQKTSFIKVVNIHIDNVIFVDYIAYESKSVLYNNKIFNQSFLIIDFSSKLHIKQWLLLYKVFCPLWSDIKCTSSIA